MAKRIGFACKFMHPNQSQSKKLLEELQRPLNERSTTITWLNRQSKNIAEQRLEEIIKHNISALESLVKYVGSLHPELRMLRIGSGLLPAYTENYWSYFYQSKNTQDWIGNQLQTIGNIARDLNVRLSMHPGQFTVLASDREEVVKNSIVEFEYHADIARWLGYGNTFQDFKINVHISGKKGPQGIRDVLPLLSTEARNCITIENDEMSWGLDSSLELEHEVPLVLDIHHHFVATGEYIRHDDDRVKRVIDSWRGVRPVLHYSVSREDYLLNHDPNILPNYSRLLENGYKKSKLRAHSDYFWNNACNDWALTFWEKFDIMCESKCKNLASIELHRYFNKAGDSKL